MTYEVKLEVFEGPIDLLLHLITRKRVDIYEVSLAEITDEYLAAVRGMERLDLEGATGFLVVAAALLELKSARLLPGRTALADDHSLLEQRDLLLYRLVECSTFRSAGEWLEAALRAERAFLPRLGGLEPELVDHAPSIVTGVTPADVAAAATTILAVVPERELDLSHVAPIRATVRDAVAEIAARLEGCRDATFEELCSGRVQRIEIVVRFLAILELHKTGAVELEQSERFGSIAVRWTATATAAEAVQWGDEYDAAGAPGGGRG